MSFLSLLTSFDPTNSIYSGPLVNGKPNGKCEIYSQDKKLKYEGIIDNGNIIGNGTLTLITTNQFYEGDWEKGKPHGKGVYITPNKTKYEGYWKDGLFEGMGKLVHEEREYEGYWGNGKKNGIGTEKYKNKKIYTGSWVDNKRHGNGIEFNTDGTELEGNWINDKKEGNFKKRKIVEEVTFVNGLLTSTI
jgi:hypothetical protein